MTNKEINKQLEYISPRMEIYEVEFIPSTLSRVSSSGGVDAVSEGFGE